MFSRISRGWQITKNSLTVLNANRQLIVFPVLSGLVLLALLGTFFSGIISSVGFSEYVASRSSDGMVYLLIFLYYFVAHFVMVFFNMALMHCARLYFRGEEVSVAAGLSFSGSRAGLILAWAAFSATIGTLLKIIQDKMGFLGKLVTWLLGIAWNIGTFLVVPVIAYEKLGPLDAARRSAELIKEKWGEGLMYNFSLRMLGLLGIMAITIISAGVAELVNTVLGIGLFVAGLVFISIAASTVRSIAISAVYHNMDSDMDTHFNKELLSDLFAAK